MNSTVNSQQSYYSLTRTSFLGRFVRGLQKNVPLESKKSAVHTFVKRVASISAAFFIISSFSLFDYYFESPVQGYGYEEGGLAVDEVTDQDISEIIDNVSEADGFVMKPNLTTDESMGDRSTSNEILYYHVEAGDTVASIAERYEIAIETVMMSNGFYDVNQLKEGMDIKVLPVNGVPHVVKSGDTISGIAKKYNVDEASIVRQNQLEEVSIVPDMTLIIPEGKITVLPPAPPKPTYVASSSNRSTGTTSPAVASASGSTYSDYVYSGPSAAGTLLFPVPNGCIQTQGFHGGHYAIDCANRNGGPIMAAEDGTVILVSTGSYGGGYGNYYIIDNGNGRQTLYAHHKEVYVTEGQTVKAGDVTGAMGSTGRSTGTHLHFEVRENGVKQNPNNYF